MCASPHLRSLLALARPAPPCAGLVEVTGLLQLDLETIEALAMAINAFEGGVVLVSHDERLISLVADEIWAVHKGSDSNPGTVQVFDGSFEEYKEEVWARERGYLCVLQLMGVLSDAGFGRVCGPQKPRKKEGAAALNVDGVVVGIVIVNAVVRGSVR